MTTRTVLGDGQIRKFFFKMPVKMPHLYQQTLDNFRTLLIFCNSSASYVNRLNKLLTTSLNRSQLGAHCSVVQVSSGGFFSSGTSCTTGKKEIATGLVGTAHRL